MKNKKWSQKTIIDILNAFAVAKQKEIIKLTTKLDTEILPTAHKDLARWMDTVNGHIGGFNHRALHGHDPITNLPEVYDRFGLSGVLKYPYELSKDFMTSAGIPLPGVQVLTQNNYISPRLATEWLSLNIADVFTGGLAFYSTYKLYNKSSKEKLNKSDYIFASIGIGTKIIGGISTTNPILILSGVADTIILLSSIEEARDAFKKFFDWDLVIKAGISTTLAICSGTAAATGTTTAVAALATASTGTAISTLSGAAATNATLAWIGGGSLASGGLGVAGGVAILSTGGLAVGAIVGYGVYRYLKKDKAA